MSKVTYCQNHTYINSDACADQFNGVNNNLKLNLTDRNQTADSDKKLPKCNIHKIRFVPLFPTIDFHRFQKLPSDFKTDISICTPLYRYLTN